MPASVLPHRPQHEEPNEQEDGGQHNEVHHSAASSSPSRGRRVRPAAARSRGGLKRHQRGGGAARCVGCEGVDRRGCHRVTLSEPILRVATAFVGPRTQTIFPGRRRADGAANTHSDLGSTLLGSAFGLDFGIRACSHQRSLSQHQRQTVVNQSPKADAWPHLQSSIEAPNCCTQRGMEAIGAVEVPDQATLTLSRATLVDDSRTRRLIGSTHGAPMRPS